MFKIPEVNEPEVISLDQECRVYTLGRNWTTANPIIVPQTQIKKKKPTLPNRKHRGVKHKTAGKKKVLFAIKICKSNTENLHNEV